MLLRVAFWEADVDFKVWLFGRSMLVVKVDIMIG